MQSGQAVQGVVLHVAPPLPACVPGNGWQAVADANTAHARALSGSMPASPSMHRGTAPEAAEPWDATAGPPKHALGPKTWLMAPGRANAGCTIQLRPPPTSPGLAGLQTAPLTQARRHDGHTTSAACQQAHRPNSRCSQGVLFREYNHPPQTRGCRHAKRSLQPAIRGDAKSALHSTGQVCTETPLLPAPGRRCPIRRSVLQPGRGVQGRRHVALGGHAGEVGRHGGAVPDQALSPAARPRRPGARARRPRRARR